MLGNVTGIIDYSVCVSVCICVSPVCLLCVSVCLCVSQCERESIKGSRRKRDHRNNVRDGSYVIMLSQTAV